MLPLSPFVSLTITGVLAFSALVYLAVNAFQVKRNLAINAFPLRHTSVPRNAVTALQTGAGEFGLAVITFLIWGDAPRHGFYAYAMPLTFIAMCVLGVRSVRRAQRMARYTST
jgi:hypothetical protein